MEVSAATGARQERPGAASRAGHRLNGADRLPARADPHGMHHLWRACEIVGEQPRRTNDGADQVARAALAPTRDGAGVFRALFRQRLRRALLAADADQATRRRAARQRIGAHADIFDDGTGRLTITNDADKIVAAMDRADAAARAARAAGDPRSLDELRADLPDRRGDQRVAGWRRGFASQSPSPAGRAFVVVPFETVIGLSDLPCELPGTASSARSRPARSSPPRGRSGRRCSPTSTPAGRSPSPGGDTAPRPR